jgi:hypothetical protein
MRLEPFVRALVVVGSHQPRITRDVGRQDRCKTASSGHGTLAHAPGYLLRGICSGVSRHYTDNRRAATSSPAGRVVLTPQRASPVGNDYFPPQPGRFRATPLISSLSESQLLLLINLDASA